MPNDAMPSKRQQLAVPSNKGKLMTRNAPALLDPTDTSVLVLR